MSGKVRQQGAASNPGRQARPGLAAAPPLMGAVLRAVGQPLSRVDRQAFEARLGHQFGQVRVHTDALAAASASEAGAVAYAYGAHIAFAAGRYAPHTAEGTMLLAHELAHVAQQSLAGRASAAQQAETEAIIAAARATAGVAPAPLTPAPAGPQFQTAAGLAEQASAAEREKATFADQLRKEIADDVAEIAKILDSFVMYPSEEKEVMRLLGKWANDSRPTGNRMSRFDLIIAALRMNTIEHTALFELLDRRLNDENKRIFQGWIQEQGKVFKNERAIEEVKFEIDKDQALEVVMTAGEVAVAVGTGGGSVVAQILKWLVIDLPKIIDGARTVYDLFQRVRQMRLSDIRGLFQPAGIAKAVAGALFGEITLPAVAAPQPEDKRDQKADRSEVRGVAGLVRQVIGLAGKLQSLYGVARGRVANLLEGINLTKKPHFPEAAIAYTLLANVYEVAEDPGAAVARIIGAVRQGVRSLFGKLGESLAEAREIAKQAVDIVDRPGKLLEKLADKAVEMVLNFIVTHPPSQLVKSAFKAIEKIADKPIVTLVREHIPAADDLIKGIAKSEAVANLLKPVRPPLEQAGALVTEVTEKAENLIAEGQRRAEALLNSGEGLAAELLGTATPAKSSAQPAGASEGLIDTLRHELHTRLVARGSQLIKERGVALVKRAARGVAGIIIGAKKKFFAGTEPHEFWIEKVDKQLVGFVASEKGLRLEEKLKAYVKVVASQTKSDKQAEAPKREAAAAALKGLRQINTEINKEQKKIPKIDTKRLQELNEQAAPLLGLLEFITNVPTQDYELTLPPQKIMHAALYQGYIAKGALIHRTSNIRDEEQPVNAWETQISKQIGRDKLQAWNDELGELAGERTLLRALKREAGISGGRNTPNDFLLRPNWSRTGKRLDFEVDHIVELQLFDSNAEQRPLASDLKNLQLLDKDSNSASGRAIQLQIANFRRDKGSKAGPEWINAPLRIASLKDVGKGKGIGDRWTPQEIIEGEHIDVLRELINKETLSPDASEDTAQTQGTEALVTEDPTEALVAKLDLEEHRSKLSPAMNKLSKDERKVIEMRYTNELTFKQIAEALGITSAQASALHKNAVKSLRAELSK